MSKPSRLECLHSLSSRVQDADIVVSALGETEAIWHALNPTRAGNFYIRNGMSMPTSVALGLAIAQPQRRIWALEGDGGMLMNLGSLATIASRRPANLRIIVLVNRVYQASGGQNVSPDVDFALLARGAGFSSTFSVAGKEGLDAALDNLRDAPAPALLACEIEPQSRPVASASPVPLPAEFKQTFARFLGLA